MYISFSDTLLVVLLIVAAVVGYPILLRRVVVRQFECGLLYRRGRFIRRLEPGLYRMLRSSDVSIVDLRTRTVSVPGQELLTEDHVGLKVSLALRYSVEAPETALHTVDDYQQALYLAAQLELRAIVAGSKVDTLLERRAEFGSSLLERLTGQAAGLGLKLHAVDLKDITFPGELKKIFAEVVRARKEGEAALERARGETAALRSLANAARMIESNPALFQLRLLQALSAGKAGPGGSFVFDMPAMQARSGSKDTTPSAEG